MAKGDNGSTQGVGRVGQTASPDGKEKPQRIFHDDDRLLTVKEAAHFLGVSRSKFYLIMAKGEIRWVALDGEGGRGRRIPKQEMVRFSKKRLTGGWLDQD